MANTLKLIQTFCPEAIEEFTKAHYVYALVDPRLDATDIRRYFYVGKGIGTRCFAHAAEELKRVSAGDPNPKLEWIAAIRKATGQRPPIEIVDHGLTEAEAFRLESILIKLLKTDANLVYGQRAHSYWRSVEDVDSEHANPLQESELGACVLLVNLNGNKHAPPWPGIQEKDLDGRVLGNWPVSADSAARVQYVVGVYRQLVRCVYAVPTVGTRFHRFQKGKNIRGLPLWKCKFYGERDLIKESLWAGRRIEDANGALLTKFPPQRGSRIIGKGPT